MMKTPADIIARQREAFRQFMKLHKVNANNWSKMAGIAEATIRHYLSGRNHSITSLNLELLAQAVGAKLSDIVGDRAVMSDPDDLNTFIAADVVEIQRDFFVQAYEDCQTLQALNLGKSPEEQANAIFSWYQLAKLYQRAGKATPRPEDLQHILYKK